VNAIVLASVAPMCGEPRAGAEQVSQTVYGRELEVLERRDPWLRVLSGDGYEGWIHRGFVSDAEVDVRRFATAGISLGARIEEPGGRRIFAPFGARIEQDASVERGEMLDNDTMRASRFPAAGAAIVVSAMGFFEGTPYQWGGITPLGADCSGMVQSVFALHGIALPRDSRQQAERGVDAGSDVEALRAGDLLFFSDREDGRITHVAIAVGPSRIVHLAIGRGGYAVEDLTRDEPYVRALVGRFKFARRVL
jgi:hypothetical protein